MHNYKKILLLCLVALLSLLISCGGGGDDGGEPEKPGKVLAFDGEAYTVFASDSKSSFDVVYDSKDAITIAKLAIEFCNIAMDKGLPKPILVADRDKTESELEFLVGDTDRALSAEAKAIVEENLAKDPNGKHWVWLYKNGQLALYANDEAAYKLATSDFIALFFKDGVFKVKNGLKEIGHLEGPHDAYMSYDIPDNFYDVYTDPFGMEIDDYKQMTVTLVNETTYRIAYSDERGGKFTADLVQKVWGVWNMGAITYVDENGKVNNITATGTDYEFVIRVNGKGSSGLKSGNHGNYPKDSLWKPWIDPETGKEDPTSYYNDMLLDITFYDAKTGEKLVFDKIGKTVNADGVRIIEHHNIYEFGYRQENVLVNAERSYLYNGYDIMCDTKLYMTQDVRFGSSHSTMLPISKKYGNCAMFYCDDGSTVYIKTPLSNTVNELKMGIDSTKIDIWGENNPKYHMIISINNPEDQHKNASSPSGLSGFREMLGGGTNKFYSTFFSDPGTMAWGEELHFNTSWSLSIQDDFKNPSREPDYLIGVKK